MPSPFPDGGHWGICKTLRDRSQIIAASQMMARLEREIIHRAEYPAIARASEADRLHRCKLAANLLFRDAEPLEEAPK